MTNELLTKNPHRISKIPCRVGLEYTTVKSHCHAIFISFSPIKRARIPTYHRSAIARNGAFVVQIFDPMIRDSLGRDFGK